MCEMVVVTLVSRVFSLLSECLVLSVWFLFFIGLLFYQQLLTMDNYCLERVRLLLVP